MASIFSEEWNYPVGTPIPAHPSKLGGLWFKTGIFGGTITAAQQLLHTKSLGFDVEGGIGYENGGTSFVGGTFVAFLRGGDDTGGYFKSLEFYDAAIPPTGPFPNPILMCRFYLESDGTMSVRDSTGIVIGNSGKIMGDTGPLGFESTSPWSMDPTRWYMFQFNIEFGITLFGFLTIKLCVHVDSQPILVRAWETTTHYTAFPNGTPLSISFNRINLYSPKNNTSYCGFFSFDSDSTIPTGSTDPLKQSALRATQAVIEAPFAPNSREAHITQAVIELPTLPTRAARITQAVIELMTTGIISRVKRWRIYEA